ncbi:uncharacterized protein LOC116424866 [Nomia melanderi]|uniref:uncharacterized protein LOC116424866 n=1 Tax=Nomia melanderi TaxID=2448451 RepID=UPI0013044951|nr:uncharacterized protein LOC116424866 [Nomia melanderi]
MTPLPRWVLLASVLAVVGAQPGDNACVHACRARERSPEITGVICDHRRSAVLQSAGGRSPIQRLSSICLTPCAPTSHYDGSEACRDFRELLIRSRACLCDDRKDDNSRSIRTEHSKNFDRVDHRELRSFKSAMLKKLAIADHYLVLEPLENDSYRFRVEMRPDERRFEDTRLSDLNLEGPTLTESTESDVDWDMWCMAQCDNGRGGSACNCDLIP